MDQGIIIPCLIAGLIKEKCFRIGNYIQDLINNN